MTNNFDYNVEIGSVFGAAWLALRATENDRELTRQKNMGGSRVRVPRKRSSVSFLVGDNACTPWPLLSLCSDIVSRWAEKFRAEPTRTGKERLGGGAVCQLGEAIATVEALKGDLAELAVKLAQLEKRRLIDCALKQAERERIDAEKARLEIEQTEAAQKAAFALIAQLDTHKDSSPDAKANTWRLAVIAAIVILVVCLLAWTFRTRLM